MGKYPLNAGICDTLVRMDEPFGIEPMLADRWTYDESRTPTLGAQPPSPEWAR